MKRIWIVAALVAALAVGPALAHEAGDRAMGTVESVTADRIVIRAPDGHRVEFVLTPETQFSLGDKNVRREDVRVGQRAVVHGKRTGNEVQALRVKLGSARRAQ